MRKSLLKKKSALLVFFMAGLLFMSSFLSVFAFPSATAKVTATDPVPAAGKNIDDHISLVDDPALGTSEFIDPDKFYGKMSALNGDDEVKVIIVVDDRSLVSKFNESAYKEYGSVDSYIYSLSGQAYESNMIRKQNEIKRQLSASFDIKFSYSYTALMNGFAATVKYKDIEKIEEVANISRVVRSETYAAPQVSSYEVMASTGNDAVTNFVEIDESTGIFNASNSGYDGTGTIVAVIDTGLDYTHQAFKTPLSNLDKMVFTKDKLNEILSKDHGLVAGTEEYGYTARLSAEDLFISNKIPFGYDYADHDTDVFPTEDHGTHVAGIIAGQDDTITGVAPQAQLAIMKVFPDADDGSESEEILAAVEDCVRLGVDSINMSLGRDSGFAREEDDKFTDTVYDHVREAGITLICAASNSYSSGFNSTYGTNLKTNPDSGTVGSPSTYEAALSVASISGKKSAYLLANRNPATGKGTPVYFNNSVDNNSEEIEFLDDLYKKQNYAADQKVELDYVVIPGIGKSTSYTGLNVKGKVALIQRGTSTFEEKIKTAQDHGAIAALIYNNVSGTIRMVIGKDDVIPACSIDMEVGQILVEAAAANKAAGGVNGGKLYIDRDNLAGPFMSDFSSWGPSPDLELKPEITAHGGDIYSAVIGGGYDHLSGTSMASPNLCGIATLLRQYVKNNLDKYVSNLNSLSEVEKTAKVRALVNQLLMSTATPALTKEGDPYSPRKQGAGLANLTAAIKTSAYLYVERDVEQENGTVVKEEYDKTKLSLGDDPNRTGEYKLEFKIKNISSTKLVYSLDTLVMTETVSVDQKTVAERAYMINDSTISVTAGNGVTVAPMGNNKYRVDVNANADANITINIKLSDATKKYLDDNFANGMYVEGFVRLTPPSENDYKLNIPYLAFYGDWTDAPILDLDWKTVYADKFDNSIPDEDKIQADVKPITLIGRRTVDGEDYLQMLGDYIYLLPETGGYQGPTYHDEYVSLSLQEESMYDIYMIGGFLRNAKNIDVTIRNTATGELMVQHTFKNASKAGPGGYGGVIMYDTFPVTTFISENEKKFEEGNKYTFEFTCSLDYPNGDKAPRNTYAFDFVIDSAAPVVEDFELRVEYQPNDTVTRYRYYLDLFIYDNNYPQGFALRYYDKNSNRYISPVGNYMIPINAKRNSVTKMTVEVTDFWEKIKESDYNIYISTADYSFNESAYYIKLVDFENDNLGIYNDIKAIELADSFKKDGQNELNKELQIYQEYDLFKENALKVTSRWDEDYKKFMDACVAAGKADLNADGTYKIHEGEEIIFSNWLSVERDAWFEDYEFSSDNENIMVVSDMGVITPKASGSANITIRSKINEGVSTTFKVTANDIHYENRNEIGITRVEMSDTYMSLPVGATYQVSCKILPLNTTRNVRIRWSMNNNPYATFTTDPENTYVAYVTGLKEGSTTIRATVQTSTDGGTTWEDERLYIGTCTLVIPEEFVVEYGTLNRYNGAEKNLVIPDDLGIKTIGSGVFFEDQNLETLVIPEGVEKIEQAAFAYCPNLKKVTLPSTLETIGMWGFAGYVDQPVVGEAAVFTSQLEEVVINNDANGKNMLRYIGKNAFIFNTKLTRIDLSKVVVIDSQAFYACFTLKYYGGNDYDPLDLSSAKSIGELAFADCGMLLNVIFKENTYIGRRAFAGDINLGTLDGITIEIPSSRIGEEAFMGCSSVGDNGQIYGIRNLVLSGDKVVIGKGAFSDCRNLRSVTFQKTVTTIFENAFENATSLTTVTLPEGLDYLGNDAFKNCTSLTTVEIGRIMDIKNFNAAAFNGCTSLRNIRGTGNKNFKITNNIIYSSDGTEILMVLPTAKLNGSYSVPENVTRIADYAFVGNTTLTTIDLKNVETIGEGAFAGCTSLTTVTITESVDSIPAYAFDGCSALQTVTFEEKASIESLGKYAFRNCTSLSTIEIKGNLETIEVGTFSGDNKLTEVKVDASLKTIEANAFENCALLNTFDINSVETIQNNAFYGCAAYAPNAVNAVNIGDYAFFGNTALVISSLPNAEYIGRYAFSQTGITEINMPKVKEIREYAFGIDYIYNASEDDAEATAHNQLTSKVTAVTMPKVEKIYDGAFSGATGLTTVNIPETTVYIGKMVFADTGLTTITVAADNKVYKTNNDNVLYRMTPEGTGLELVCYPTKKEDASYKVIPDTIRIERGAFINNKSLTSIDLPYELFFIGNYAFYGCDKLQTFAFHSLNAPVLEFDYLFYEDYRTWGAGADKYSNMSREDYLVGRYNNFGPMPDAHPESFDAVDRKLSYPSNGNGYTDYLYARYFVANNAERTTEVVKDEITLALIKTIEQLPDPSSLSAENAASFRSAWNSYSNLDAAQKELLKREEVELCNKIENAYTMLVQKDLLYEKVTLHFEGVEGDAYKDQTINRGSQATRPEDPTKKGYTFDGWYTDENFQTKFEFYSLLDRDTTIYAKWTEGASQGGKSSGCSCGTTFVPDNFGGYIGGGILLIAIVGLAVMLRRKKTTSK